jgi:hypothetical protein
MKITKQSQKWGYPATRKLQYTGQSVWTEASSVSDLKSNGLAGILPFNRSNLCTRL